MLARIQPSRLQGSVTVPPSKSMAHRALLCAGLAAGTTQIQGILPSQDMEATCRALTALGASIARQGSLARVQGVDGRPKAPQGPVDCGESGSTLRFLIPAFALASAPARLTGRGRLPQRPLGPYGAIFHGQGLPFAQDETGVSFQGPLAPGDYGLPGDVSSQFISGLLFALPLLPGDSHIRIQPPFESRGYVNMTLQVMDAFGVQAAFLDGLTLLQPPFESRGYVNMTLQVMDAFGVQAAFLDGLTLHVPGNQRFTAPAAPFLVEGDDSQAAFFLTLDAILGDVSVAGLSLRSIQGDRVMGEILARCGHVPGQPPRPLAPFVADLGDCPDLGPILMTLGLFCRGESRLLNAGRLRLKESDRGTAMAQELGKLGGQASLAGDEIRIRQSRLRPGPALSSHGDHRIAMALAVAALGARIPADIQGAEAVEKSYPDFWKDLAAIGARVELCHG